MGDNFVSGAPGWAVGRLLAAAEDLAVPFHCGDIHGHWPPGLSPRPLSFLSEESTRRWEAQKVGGDQTGQPLKLCPVLPAGAGGHAEAESPWGGFPPVLERPCRERSPTVRNRSHQLAKGILSVRKSGHHSPWGCWLLALRLLPSPGREGFPTPHGEDI